MNRRPTPYGVRVFLGFLYLASVFVIAYWFGLWIMSWEV